MDIQKISNEIATLKRAVKTAATVSLKDKLKKKIASLNEVLKDANIPAKKLAMMLLGAKRKVAGYTTAEFNAVIKRLSYKAEYTFLKGLTKVEIKDDLERHAKNPGWRFKGKGNFKTPTKSDLINDMGKPTSKRKTYYESRSNRSDVTHPAKLARGGGVGDDNIYFSVDDDKLDELLIENFRRYVDYKNIDGDMYYVMEQKKYDHFIDLAMSNGFDVDSLIDERNSSGEHWVKYKGQQPSFAYKNGGGVEEKDGLYVTGRTREDNTKIGEMIDAEGLYAEFNVREGYWFFPEERDMYDDLEKLLENHFAEYGINARFEGVFAKGGGVKNKPTQIPFKEYATHLGIKEDLIEPIYNIYMDRSKTSHAQKLQVSKAIGPENQRRLFKWFEWDGYLPLEIYNPNNKMAKGGAVKGAKFKHDGRDFEIKKVEEGVIYTTNGKQYSLKTLESFGVTFNKERAKSNKPRGVRGQRREEMENHLEDLKNDLKYAKQDLRDIKRDMEEEAGQKGDKWTDADANRYGEQMNFIEDQIESLEKQIAEKEEKLSYANGGGLDEEDFDLFEEFDNLPKDVQDIFFEYEEADDTYERNQEMLGRLQPLGYTFDYGLDAIPFGLKKMKKGGTLTANDIPKGTWLQNDSTKVLAKVWNVDPRLGMMQLEDIYGNRDTKFRYLKGWSLVKAPGKKLKEIKEEWAEMATGGGVENENKEMVLNNTQQIEHHAEELENAAKKSKHVPAWVVAKVYNASSNISDATHYLEGVNTMPKEQFERIHEEIQNHKMADGGGLNSFMDKQMHISKVCKTHGCSSKDYLHAKNKYVKGGPTKAQEKVGKVMHEFKEGTLHSGKSGKVVKNPKQAIAIALSEAGLSKKIEGGEVKPNFEISKIKEIVDKNINLNNYKIQREDDKALLLANKYKDISIDFRLDIIQGMIWFGGFSKIEISSISLADPLLRYQNTSARRVVHKKINVRKAVSSYSALEKLLKNFLTKVGELDKKENGGKLTGWKHKK